MFSHPIPVTACSQISFRYKYFIQVAFVNPFNQLRNQNLIPTQSTSFCKLLFFVVFLCTVGYGVWIILVILFCIASRIYIFSVIEAPKLYSTIHVRPNQCQIQLKDNFLAPVAYTSRNKTQPSLFGFWRQYSVFG